MDTRRKQRGSEPLVTSPETAPADRGQSSLSRPDSGPAPSGPHPGPLGSREGQGLAASAKGESRTGQVGPFLQRSLRAPSRHRWLGWVWARSLEKPWRRGELQAGCGEKSQSPGWWLVIRPEGPAAWMSAGTPGTVGDPSGEAERDLRGRGSGKGRGPCRRGRRWAGKRDSGQMPGKRGGVGPCGVCTEWPDRPGPRAEAEPPEHVRRRRFGAQRRRPPTLCACPQDGQAPLT